MSSEGTSNSAVGSPTHEADHGPAPPRVSPDPPPAKPRPGRWPGWIWAIPIAALIIVGWLGFKQLIAEGPKVTVSFPTVTGIEAGNTEVQYNGLKVGEVDAVHLQEDLRHMDVSIRMLADMKGRLGRGTEFYLANTSPSLTDLGSIKSVLSGPTIGIVPKLGRTQNHYQGLPEAPVVPDSTPGHHFMLHTHTLGNLGRGSPIYFEGLKVGNVEATALMPDRGFDITIFVKNPFDTLVHTDTRFWNSGAVQISMPPNGPKLQVQSLAALMHGAVNFEAPPAVPPAPLAPDRYRFELYDSQQAAAYAPGPQAVTYRVVFPVTDAWLDTGASVRLGGKRVGTVTHSSLQYDPQSGRLSQIVAIAIQPGEITLTGGARWPEHPRQAMDAAMTKFIAQGMRAQLGSGVPMLGPKDVELVFARGPEHANLIPGDPPQIPAVGGGTDLNGTMEAMNRVAGKLDSLPLDRIGKNIREITDKLSALSQSPQLMSTLQKLDSSATNVERLTADANRQMPKLVSQLRHTAGQADAAVADARTILSNRSGLTATGTETSDLGQTLYQLSQAARSIRQLADMLDRNPTAWIRGKE